jgi:PAS domain S-box-containing protein
MALHPGERKRHFPEDLPIAFGLLRQEAEEDRDWYRDLVEHSQDLLCVHDLEGRFLSVNPVPARVLGYTVEEVMRRPMRDFIDPQFRDRFESYLREIAATGESRGLMAVITRSGEQRIWEYHNTLRTEGVSAPIVRGIAHDVTERVRAERALRATNAQLIKTAEEREKTLRELTLFRALLDQSNDSIKVIDPDSLRFLDANEKACAELGYSREELLSMSVFDIDPTVNENLIEQARQRWRDTEFAVMEAVHRRKDGTTFPVEVNIRRVKLDREYCISISRDITDRKRADDRLREFERVVENLEEMIGVVNREYRYVIVNRAFLSYREMTKEQVVGRSVAEVLNPDIFASVLKEKLDKCFRGDIVNFELKYDYPKLGERQLAITYLPVEGPSGIDRVACVLRDVTEHNRAVQALRESEARERARAKELQTVLEAVPVPVLIAHDPACRRITANLAGYQQMRIPPGTSFSRSGPPEAQPTFRLFDAGVEIPVHSLPMQYAAATGESVEQRPLTMIFEDGSQRETLMNAVPLLDDEGKVRGAVGASIDLTEQKEAERALRESEERFRVALKNSPIAVFHQDRDLRYTWLYNVQFPGQEGDYLGRTPSECFGPDEGKRIMDLRQGVLDTGVGVRHEVQFVEGNKKYYFDSTIEPVLDATGAVIGITGASMDVTDLRETTEQLREAKKKLTEEKFYLEQEIDSEMGFGEIVGQSKSLQAVMLHVGKVAASDATVLVLGETGTGKELVARAIHRLSGRADNSFIKLNCAAIPSGLLESELFGNEKGAFTGAVSRKIGRLELADKGTLFLDEIGEISLALQPKLLRVLQDQEFERLGGTHTLKVDFRLIAATNRDLADSVRESEFRSDLYYRLNVFPIRVPPLRERREDIPLLVEHFVMKCSRRMNKSITSVPKKTMDALREWEWPGNVRELENFVERSVILTQGSVLVSPLTELKLAGSEEQIAADDTLEATEREHILRALRESHGQIGGLRGAATRLGLKRTTLQSKLKHLGINPRSTAS